MKKILLLSGYDAASHRYWRNLLVNHFKQFDWTQLALSDRNFAWRVRGSSLNFAFQYPEETSKNYDLIIATSMVDLASLRGFVPQLANIPSIVYFHENQFVYPLSDSKTDSILNANAISAQLTSMYSAICANKVLFNSHYNLTSFLSGVERLLKRLPDKFPSVLLDSLKSKSKVLAVPIAFPLNIQNRQSNKEVTIVWNHRWEYDKQPEVFFKALLLFKNAGYSFKLNVLGQSFRNVPDCFTQAQKDFSAEIENFGFQSKTDYENILNRADIAVSTALHDFQGLSIMQAISRGCFPIVPDRVVYPEYISETHLYRASDDLNQEAENLFNKLVYVVDNNLIVDSKLPEINHYSCDSLLPSYLELFDTLMSHNSKP